MRILQELIDELQNLIETGECTGEEMVLFAHQPNYPLQCSIDGPHVVEDDEYRPEPMEDDGEVPKIVYLCEGGWRPRRADGSEISPYAPRSAWGEG